MLALKEIRLDVYVENIAAQTLDRVIERKNVHALSIFDVKTLVNVDKIAELDAKVVTCDLVHLYTTFLDIVGAQTDEDSIPPLLSAEEMSGSGRNGRELVTNRTMIVSPRKSPSVSIVPGLSVATRSELASITMHV